MTGHYSRNAWRRRIGGMTLAALLAGAALAQSPEAPPMPMDSGASPDMQHGAFPPPPPDALKNREQGVVLLKVLVGVDGSARKIETDPDNKASPELTKAATDAAMKWHFCAKQENGKTTEAWEKVPVRFSLSLMPPHPPGPPHGGDMPPPPPGAPMPPSPATQSSSSSS